MLLCFRGRKGVVQNAGRDLYKAPVVQDISEFNFQFIRKACKDGKVSLACGLSVGVQSLKALEQLHKVSL